MLSPFVESGRWYGSSEVTKCLTMSVLRRQTGGCAIAACLGILFWSIPIWYGKAQASVRNLRSAVVVSSSHSKGVYLLLCHVIAGHSSAVVLRVPGLTGFVIDSDGVIPYVVCAFTVLLGLASLPLGSSAVAA